MIRPLPLACVCLGIAALPAFALTYTVDRTDDSAIATACTGAANDCSLRGAILAANASGGPDVIDVPAGTYALTITGRAEDAAATGDLDVTDDLMLTGAGAATTIIDGGGVDRVIHTDPLGTGITVTIDGVTIQNGSSIVISGVLADGGGVRNGTSNTSLVNTGGTLTIKNSVVQGNMSERSGAGIANSGTLFVFDSTITGNVGTSVNTNGGGVFQDDAGSSVIARTTISGNTAQQGGGVFMGLFSVAANPNVTIDNSTISANTSPNAGGIFYNRGTLVLRNTTVSGNTFDGIFSGDTDATLRNCTIAGNASYGIDGPGFTLVNTIVAGNDGGGSGFDCNGTITSAGHNLIQTTNNCTIGGDTTGNLLGVDPKLGALADNGGPTLTRAIAQDSPALDAGDPGTPGGGGTACEAADQRGTARPQPVGGTCDIGAFELAYVPATTTSTSTSTSTTTSTTTSSAPGSTTTTSTTTTTSPVPTSTSTSTTTSKPSSTTVPPTECAAVPIAPRFRSLACRVAALLARMKEETGLGVFQPKLIHSVEKAQTNLEDAAMLCATTAKTTKKAKKRLQQAAKAVGQTVHRLSGLPARKKLDEGLREQLIDAATPIGADMKTLRGNLVCPDDAAAILESRAGGAPPALAGLHRTPRRA